MKVKRLKDKVKNKTYILYRIRYKTSDGYWNTFLEPKKIKKKMKFAFFIIAMAMVTMFFLGCDKSEGKKYGILQKVSHKKFPCDYYVAEFAYEGGRVTTTDKSSSFSNTQEVTVSNTAADTLDNYIGQEVIFDYEDRGMILCEESKILTFIRLKNRPDIPYRPSSNIDYMKSSDTSVMLVWDTTFSIGKIEDYDNRHLR